MEQIVKMELGRGLSAGAKHLVAVKMLKSEADVTTREAFAALMESKLMERHLTHANVSNLIGVCTAEEPSLMVMQYLNHGLLRHYLEDARMVPPTPRPRPPHCTASLHRVPSTSAS